MRARNQDHWNLANSDYNSDCNHPSPIPPLLPSSYPTTFMAPPSQPSPALGHPLCSLHPPVTLIRPPLRGAPGSSMQGQLRIERVLPGGPSQFTAYQPLIFELAAFPCFFLGTCRAFGRATGTCCPEPLAGSSARNVRSRKKLACRDQLIDGV